MGWGGAEGLSRPCRSEDTGETRESNQAQGGDEGTGQDRKKIIYSESR